MGDVLNSIDKLSEKAVQYASPVISRKINEEVFHFGKNVCIFATYVR